METERPHRSGSELFICFTSRNCSSMKISSKSILSPGRSEKFREPSLSLSSSLSRRLRSNGSMKGGQASPMFPTGSKKKGSSFETAEPSSPKVTCIGQVRVKTKKQGQKMRTRSKRRGEVSFRKTEQIQEGILLHHHPQQQQQECLPHRNQRWVHLPLSICEALRAFGAEFSCFLPCRSSCLTGEKEKGEKKRNNRATTETNSTSSCKAVFARWVMTLQENDEEKRRDMELELVSREEERREKREVVGEIEMQISEEKGGVICNEVEEEEEGRVSICIPPRNALLLMRCRSEPFRMSALANRFWESPIPKEDENQQEEVLAVEEDEDVEDEDEKEVVVNEEDEEEDEIEVKVDVEEEQKEVKVWESPEKGENREDLGKVEDEQEQENQKNPENDDEEEVKVIKLIEEEIMVNGSSSPEALNGEEIPEIEENEEDPRFVEREEEEEEEELVMEVKEEREESRRASFSSRRVSVSSCTRSFHEEEEEETEPETEPEPEPVVMAAFEERVEKSTEPKVMELGIVERERERIEVQERSATEEPRERKQQIDDHGDDEDEEKSKERESDLLPDCLLLMMCEPKLSMEVSKETWVCSTDFIRYRPERKIIQNQKDGGDESKKRLSTDSKRLSTDSNPGGRPPLSAQHSNKHQHQKPPTPPRRSCSKPAPPAKPTPPPSKPAPAAAAAVPSSMATMIEQKLVDAVAYEPFVLTRCKSEPMRSSAKLAPEACFWKNMKLEPHAQGPPSLGVGATGMGF